MNVGAPAAVRAGSSLPRLNDYLRAVLDLGRRSLRPALPALAFLYFFRVGVGAYMALTDTTYLLGRDALAAVVPRLAIVASFLPLLLLIYTPFLPLQDSVLRGQPISFGAAMRRALENTWPWTVSGIAQLVVFLVPVAVICVFAAVLMPGLGGGEPTPSTMMVLALLVIATFFSFLITGTLLMFATPAVVLDGQGPLQSIGSSVRLVLSHLGGVVGRLFVFAFLATLVYILATMPAQMLQQIERASGTSSVGIKLAVLVWSSLADTILFPFWVAAMMILYRSLVPAAPEARSGTSVPLEDEHHRATAPNAPFE